MEAPPKSPKIKPVEVPKKKHVVLGIPYFRNQPFISPLIFQTNPSFAAAAVSTGALEVTS